MDNLAALREEYAQEGGIGRLLRELLSKIVWSTVHQYPPAEYSPYGSWDQPGCEDVLHDWVLERLFGRADLQSMLSSAPNTAQLRAALTTSLRQFLSNKRRRSVASNLYKRIVALMRDDSQFMLVGAMSSIKEQRWGLAGNNGQCSELSIDELVDAAFELSDSDLEVVRYGPFSQKLSPILRDGKLSEFVHFLLSRARGSLTVATIVEVMRLRFSLPVEEQAEIDDSIPSPALGPATQAGNAIAARSVVSRLTFDGVRILASYFKSEGDLKAAAQSCQCELWRVHEVIEAAFTAISECAESEENARSIMNEVESLLVRGD